MWGGIVKQGAEDRAEYITDGCIVNVAVNLIGVG